jgi:hypothetical protein
MQGAKVVDDRREGAHGERGRADAEGEARGEDEGGFGHEKEDDVPPPGTERHADADLMDA